MTAQQSHIDEETRGIASTLAHRVDALAQHVASAVRAEVDFYNSTRAVTDDDLLASCTANLRFALKSLEDGVAFDTSPAATTGSRRAAAGIPLPAVMDAYRVASYRLWDAVVDIATEKRGVSRDMVIEATRTDCRRHLGPVAGRLSRHAVPLAPLRLPVMPEPVVCGFRWILAVECRKALPLG